MEPLWIPETLEGRDTERLARPAVAILPIALLVVLACTPAVARGMTYYVDGACPGSGTGTALGCGATGPFKAIQEGIDAVTPGDTLYIRGPHGSFDGVYREYIKLWGASALTCTAGTPCRVEGCPQSVCGGATDERPIISGFLEPPHTGWTREGSGVYSRPSTCENWRSGSFSSWAPEDRPDDYSYGTDSRFCNPMGAVLEGPRSSRRIMQFGGRCDNGDPCGHDDQCAGSCDLTTPGDGYWSFNCSCSGSCQQGDCRVYLNPSGANDPTRDYDVWIPNRHALMVAYGKPNCPHNENRCPPTTHTTFRRLAFEGARWVGIEHEWRADDITYDDVTVRYIPRYAVKIGRGSNQTLQNMTVEHVGRGVAAETGGSFGFRTFAFTNGTMHNNVVRHVGQAGGKDKGFDGIPDGSRSTCEVCDPPWDDADSNPWRAPSIGIDIKQTSTATLTGTVVRDVTGQGIRIDASNDVTIAAADVRQSALAIAVDQFTPAGSFTRVYNITIKDSYVDGAGGDASGGINIGQNVAAGVRNCVTPLQDGEFITLHNNVVTRNAFAGIWLCYNSMMCSNTLGTCDDDGDCPGGRCVPSSGNGTIAVYNNTVWQDRENPRPAGGNYRYTDATGIRVESTTKDQCIPTIANLKIENNLIMDVAEQGQSDQGAIFLPHGTWSHPGFRLDHNLYYNGEAASWSLLCLGDASCRGETCYASLDAVRTGAAFETHGVAEDPRLAGPRAGDFRLCTGRATPVASCTAASPAIDAGRNVGLPFTGRSPDIGAAESSGPRGRPERPTLVEIAPVPVE
jgi:hypothetical protein